MRRRQVYRSYNRKDVLRTREMKMWVWLDKTSGGIVNGNDDWRIREFESGKNILKPTDISWSRMCKRLNRRDFSFE